MQEGVFASPAARAFPRSATVCARWRCGGAACFAPPRNCAFKDARRSPVSGARGLPSAGGLAGDGQRRGVRQIAPKRRHGRARSGGRALALRQSRPPWRLPIAEGAGFGTPLCAGCGREVNSAVRVLGKRGKGATPRRQSRGSKRATDVRACKLRGHRCSLAQGGRRGSSGERRNRSWHLVGYAVG